MCVLLLCGHSALRKGSLLLARIPLTQNDIRVALGLRAILTTGQKPYVNRIVSQTHLSQGRASEGVRTLGKEGLIVRQVESHDEWRGYGRRRVFLSPSEKGTEFFEIVSQELTLIKLSDATLEACEAMCSAEGVILLLWIFAAVAMIRKGRVSPEW